MIYCGWIKKVRSLLSLVFLSCVLSQLLLGCEQANTSEPNVAKSPQTTSSPDDRSEVANDNLKRVALIVGNGDYNRDGDYKDMGDLVAAKADVKAMEALFKTELKFDKVIVAENLNRTKFRRKLTEFEKFSKTADVAVFYYSGHGLVPPEGSESEMQNYLVPVGVDFADEDVVDDLEAQTISLSSIRKKVERRGLKTILLLDACRNNPFGEQMAVQVGKDTNKSINVRKGLVVEIAPRDSESMIAFAARHGQVAIAPKDGSMSYFTRALSEHLNEPVALQVAMSNVRGKVRSLTNNKQEPETVQRLNSALYLSGSEIADGWAKSDGMQSKPSQSTILGQMRRDWETIENSTDIEEFRIFEIDYQEIEGSKIYIRRARKKISKLKKAPEIAVSTVTGRSQKNESKDDPAAGSSDAKVRKIFNPEICKVEMLEGPGTKLISKDYVFQAEAIKFIATPAVYETIIENKVVRPETAGDSTFKIHTVAEVVQESSVEYVTVPPTFETQEIVIDFGVGPNGQSINKTVEVRRVRTKGKVSERVIPAVTKMRSHYDIDEQGTSKFLTPAVTEAVNKRVVKYPAHTKEEFIPEIVKTITIEVDTGTDRKVKRDAICNFENSANLEKWVKEALDREGYPVTGTKNLVTNLQEFQKNAGIPYGKFLTKETAKVLKLCNGQSVQQIVYYPSGKGISPETPAVVSLVLERLHVCELDGVVRIVGHSDGFETGNEDLSLVRAIDIRNELVRSGIPLKDLQVEAKQFSKPFVATGPGVKEQLNRRVEILAAFK